MVYWFIIAKGYAPMAAENENTTLSSDRSKHFKVGIGEKTIEKLFNEDKMLVRAMDEPFLRQNDNCLFYDFSVWAEEVDIARNDRLTSLSSTLLVPGEKIPTYKNMGFLLNSEKADIIHVADSDSGSMGNVADGDFSANQTDLKTLSDLAAKTRTEKLRDMNEVNVNIKDDAIVGLFVNKCHSERPKAMILLAQEYYKLQTGKELPIFTYDQANGNLQPLKMSKEEKKDFLEKMHQNKQIHSSVIGYTLNNVYTEETKYTNIVNEKSIEWSNTSQENIAFHLAEVGGKLATLRRNREQAENPAAEKPAATDERREPQGQDRLNAALLNRMREQKMDGKP